MGCVGGPFRREGRSVYIWLIHSGVQQKLTQHYKATILYNKNIIKRKEGSDSYNEFPSCNQSIGGVAHV